MNKEFHCLLLAFSALSASAVTFSFDNVLKNVPDNDPAGVTDTHTVPSIGGTISDLNVFLNISGDFNGDLYAILSHENDRYSVLLNRIGRGAADDLGFASGGLNVTLDDQAALDIHTADPTATAGALFQPDAREDDPDLVVSSGLRTAFLSNFNGIDASGDWTLFVADLNGGGTSTLVSWGLEFNSAPVLSVPESPGWAGVLTLVTICGVHFVRRTLVRARRSEAF